MSLMAFFNIFMISLFVFNITIFILPIYAKKSCKSSNCTNDSLQIRFPFLLKGQQDEGCGYPGFDLTCSSQGLPAIDFPFSGRFLIQNISYNQQIIQLSDPNNCLTKRLIELNLSGSPFMDNSYSRGYSLLSCPFGFNSSVSYTVNCLSNSTNTVIAVKYEYAIFYDFRTCVEMVKLFYVPFPSGYIFESYNYKFDYLWLSWNNPQCRYCEMDGGVCGPSSTVVGSQGFKCNYRKPASHVVKSLLMSLGIPAIIIFVALACYKCYKIENSRNIDNSVNISPGSTITPPQSSTTTRGGLNDSTIQSYPIVIIGENSISPGLKNKTCPICLYDFLAKETVRFIPDCTHCFHSDCIDEWLHLNPSCPVCRSLLTHIDSSFVNVQ